MLWQMWDGKLVPFGTEEPSKDYMLKVYYYCDFYMLNNHKNALLNHFNYYLQVSLVAKRAKKVFPYSIFRNPTATESALKTLKM